MKLKRIDIIIGATFALLTLSGVCAAEQIKQCPAMESLQHQYDQRMQVLNANFAAEDKKLVEQSQVQQKQLQVKFNQDQETLKKNSEQALKQVQQNLFDAQKQLKQNADANQAKINADIAAQQKTVHCS